MITKTFEDGSELNVVKLAAVCTVVAVTVGGGYYYTKSKYDDWQLRRTMKKYGWSQKAIDRV